MMVDVTEQQEQLQEPTPTSSLYHLELLPGKGYGLVANQDLLAGTVLILNEQPLMMYNKGASSYKAFVDLSLADQQKFLSLHGSDSEQMFQLMFAALPLTSSSEIKQMRLCATIQNIVRLNKFETDDDKQVIYVLATRFCHSCLPNCCYNIDGNLITCRTIFNVKQGEELTLEYTDIHRYKTIHERRHNYVLKKDFTCHCLRCMGPGDDTRQFPCFDARCAGRHLACQPINKEPFPFPVTWTICYTSDIEYVEPYLLPCNVCTRAPSAEYEAEMFRLEAALPDLMEEADKKLQEVFLTTLKLADINLASYCIMMVEPPTLKKLTDAIKWVASTKHLPTHAKSLPMLKLRCVLEKMQYMMFQQNNLTGLSSAAIANAELYDSIGCFRALSTSALFSEFAALLSMGKQWRSAKFYILKALRMRLIVQGRDCRDKKLDDSLMKLLDQQGNITEPANSSVCAFCEESPLCALMTLKRCGRCTRVCYCSSGCQKAHWKVHKRSCSC